MQFISESAKKPNAITNDLKWQKLNPFTKTLVILLTYYLITKRRVVIKQPTVIIISKSPYGKTEGKIYCNTLRKNRSYSKLIFTA